MPHTVKAVFTFKDQDCKEKFIEFCNGDNGLSVTRAWKGCLSLECYETSDNSMQITIWQKWESQESNESYIKHRHEDGSFDFLGELVACPPVISALRPLIFKTDKEQIEDVVKDMCHTDYTLGNRHMDDKCLFIRPTGNPLTKDGWNEMMSSSLVSVELNELVKINKLEVCGDMAYVCYTTHGKFSYKGTSNDDVAVLTTVLKKVSGKWTIVHGQRSSGRSPSELGPVFPEN